MDYETIINNYQFNSNGVVRSSESVCFRILIHSRDKIWYHSCPIRECISIRRYYLLVDRHRRITRDFSLLILSNCELLEQR